MPMAGYLPPANVVRYLVSNNRMSTAFGSDVALLIRIAKGEESALSEFYRVHEARVYSFALSRLRHEAEAAECLNEVMLEVWKHADRYEGRSKVSTWLLGIANHKVIDKMRRRGRHETVEVDDQLPDDTCCNMLDVLAGADDAQIVQRCLESLSENHRQVIHLAFYEDMSYEDIAQIAECPEGTVKTRVFHAKQRLKDCLADLVEVE